MVPRLAFGLIACTLASCGGSTTNTTSSGFCTLANERLPIILSRKDTLPTQRKVAELNAIHKQQCLQQKEPK